MAIARGAGTEIIRSATFEEVDATVTRLIVGVQHHIYTVLSVICFAKGVQADGNWINMFLSGYDSKAGTTDRAIEIFKQEMSVSQSFVWNDKFSFNGFEPTDFAGPMDDATKQDAKADQGGVTQTLKIYSESATDNFDVHITYLDQNNA